MLFLGIDIGASTIRLAVVDGSGAIVRMLRESQVMRRAIICMRFACTIEADGWAQCFKPWAGICRSTVSHRARILTGQTPGPPGTASAKDSPGRNRAMICSLSPRGSLCTPIENGRLRLNAAGGTQSCPCHADRLDSHHAGYARGVGLLSRSRFSRQQENGHPDRKHPDRHLAVEAGEHGIVRTAPTLEARDRLRG